MAPASVDTTAFVRFGTNLYSVPPRYARSTVRSWRAALCLWPQEQDRDYCPAVNLMVEDATWHEMLHVCGDADVEVDGIVRHNWAGIIPIDSWISEPRKRPATPASRPPRRAVGVSTMTTRTPADFDRGDSHQRSPRCS